MVQAFLSDISNRVRADQPVVIAGPTASGKSALALAIAECQGGVIVNADASQVYSCWRVITARPSDGDLKRAPHALYGHVRHDAPYSVGIWLREVENLLDQGQRPIIVGGTGLYLSALVEGISEIPETPSQIRAEGNALDTNEMLEQLDAETRAQIDTRNRARVQRAWEVLKATGNGLATWQGKKSAPLLPTHRATCLALDAPKDWLTPRINTRFDQMLSLGALEEVTRMQQFYDPTLPAFRAIGVPELTAVAQGTLDLDAAREQVTIATRQYAKRQRTWLRKRMSTWETIALVD